MKNILRRSLLAAVMTATGVAATAAGAFAQTAPAADATVNFQGLVGSACVFSNVTAGTIGNPEAFMLSSQSIDGGIPGSVDLSCTGDAELSVSLPQDNGSSRNILTTANDYFASARYGTGTAPNETFNGKQGSSGPIFMQGPVEETVDVNMMVDSNAPIPEGVYNYNVVVTATPL